MPDISTCRQLIRERADLLVAIPEAGGEPGAPETGDFPVEWGGEQAEELGRFVALDGWVKGYRESGDEACAEAARERILDWLEHVEVTDVERPGNTCIDIAIRLGTHLHPGWAGAVAAFAGSSAWDGGFLERVLVSIGEQVEMLRHDAIPSRPLGHHRLVGFEALLWCGARLPFLPKMEETMAAARVGLRHGYLRQVLPDGVHRERTLATQELVVSLLVWNNLLGRLVPEADAGVPPEWLATSLEYPWQTLPAGFNEAPAFADDPAGEVELATARTFREWLMGESAAEWSPAVDVAYPQGGQAFIRARTDHGEEFLAFDASVDPGPEAHHSRLNLVFRSGGRLWLADPGSLGSGRSDSMAAYGRSTRAHCAVNLDGLNQAGGDAQLTHSVSEDGLVFLRGVYEGGYRGEDGPFVTGRHERMVLWLQGRYLLVFDSVAGPPGHVVESVWPTAPTADWQHDPETLSWQSVLTGANFYLRLVQPPEGAAMTLHDGEVDPPRGWFNGPLGEPPEPAPHVVYRFPIGAAGWTSSVALAMPFDGAEAPLPVVKHPSHSPTGHLQYFELLWPDGRYDCIGWSPWLTLSVDAHCPLMSDASLVWFSLPPDDSPERIFLLDGSYLNHLGFEVFRGEPQAWHWV